MSTSRSAAARTAVTSDQIVRLVQTDDLLHLPRRLAETLRLYQRASEATSAGITVSDCRRPDMPLMYANPAFFRLTGYTPGEVLGRNCRFLQGTERDQPALDIVREALREGRQCSVLLRNFRKNGTPFWNDLIMAPMRDAAGNLTHYIGIQTDATARVEAELALQRAHADLEERINARTAELLVANQTLVDAQFETLDRLARAAEWRDDATGQHTQRVGQLAALLADSIGWNPAQVGHIERAAILHDVGKISLPDSILLKPGPLTESEHARMQLHTVSGAAILAGSEHELLQLAETVARSHHERWDGTGYPDRLAGVSIPEAGRIVAIADVFDALTHERPYKPAWSVDDAVREIARLSGNHFEPRLVQTFCALAGRGVLDDLV